MQLELDAEAVASPEEARKNILLQRARRYARMEEQDAHEEMVKLLYFEHGPSVYGIALDDLREVRVLRGFCSIPGARRTVPGIFYYRGEILSIHDLTAFMGTQAEEPARWVIIVEYDGQRMGVMARDVLDVREVAMSKVRPSPVTLGDRASCLHGIVEDGTLLLRTEALFNTPSFCVGM